MSQHTKELVEVKRDGDLAHVMKEDGVGKVDTHASINRIHSRLEEVKAAQGPAPWSVRVIYTDRMSGVLICQNPGEGNRAHFHEEDDEFWVIMEGTIEWVVDDKVIRAVKDDIVFVPRKSVHLIRVVGDRPAIRLAIGRPDVVHVYV